MSTFNRSIPLLLLCACGLAVAAPSRAQTKIGVVNFQKLLQAAPQTKAAMQALQTEFAPRRRELLTMQADLKTRNDKMEREGAVMSDADRVKAQNALRDEQSEFQSKASAFQDDVSARRNEELGKVQHYLLQEIQSYASSKGYDLVLGDVVYRKPQFDITPQVLALLTTKPATLPASVAPKPPAGPKK
ncbi:MAG TPA: OmpH family outer membrane protein [Steroidobacteraceae bacterium]|nr:OmpH family outer membrane protein [Steroidobacteraceae bacterium]